MKPPSELGSGAKKPYQAPKLAVYGDIREMTGAQNNSGKGDGGAVSGMKRTA